MALFAAPLVSYDSNLLLGLGAFGSLVIGDESGARPFRSAYAMQIFATIGGYQDHWIKWDLPGMKGGPLRWSGRLRRRAWTRAPYFGLGNESERVPDATWKSGTWYATSALRLTLPGTEWEPYASLTAVVQEVKTYLGSVLEAEAPLGIDGGGLTVLGLGVVRDTRDDEIDPKSGSMINFELRGAHAPLGSAYSFAGAHLSWRGLYSVWPRGVLAARVLADATTKGQPFFNQASFGGITGGVIGGRWFLRGLAEERLRGDGVVGLQGELRWTWAKVTWFKTLDLDWMLVPFVDAARVWVWDEAPPITFSPSVTGGLGLRLNINHLLVLRVDVGYAQDRWAEEPTRRGQFQNYILAEHPF